MVCYKYPPLSLSGIGGLISMVALIRVSSSNTCTGGGARVASFSFFSCFAFFPSGLFLSPRGLLVPLVPINK